jgi:acyl-CoA synthetase (AMP-forming)/AMP-acid ligase II
VRTTLDDPILEAWEDTREKNRQRAAIFDAQGRVARTFSQIEERADHFAGQLETIGPGKVFAIQIGNHPDWPSLFLACLRKQLVVLPLEQRISNEQKQSAFEICRVVAAAVAGGSYNNLGRGSTLTVKAHVWDDRRAARGPFS